MIKYFIIVFFLLSFSTQSYALTAEEAKIVRESVIEICRGGSLTGKSSSIQVKAEGKVTTVLFKKLAEAGLNGEAKFSKEEWEGIKPLVPETFDSNAYVKCVTELTPKFLEKFSSSQSASPTPLNIIGKWVYDDGAHYWVVRPGPSPGYKIELYTTEDKLVGEGTAVVNNGVVNFSLSSSNHYVGDIMYMMHGETNGRLEYQNNQLIGQTDDLDLEYLNNPASIPTLTLRRIQ